MTKKEISYKEAFVRLQEIQNLIEDDKLDVDELSAILKEAAGLLKTCKDKLYKVNEETRKIIQNMQ
ncbi:MAG: exodeoxyribonuclease VII small subunit [Dysgonamonadaceae bacterium]|jgi:exodeoxyribonuclease VII small subunit|nr:exodeoxyribonuclease VII small subunit [Dysgonamonadaceae bacterium]